jgi:hypothetical protein
MVPKVLIQRKEVLRRPGIHSRADLKENKSPLFGGWLKLATTIGMRSDRVGIGAIRRYRALLGFEICKAMPRRHR